MQSFTVCLYCQLTNNIHTRSNLYKWHQKSNNLINNELCEFIDNRKIVFSNYNFWNVVCYEKMSAESCVKNIMPGEVLCECDVCNLCYVKVICLEHVLCEFNV